MAVLPKLSDKIGTVDGVHLYSWKAGLERDQSLCTKAHFNWEHVILRLLVKFFQIEKYSYLGQIRAGANLG